MANTKISQLTPNTNPTGNEELVYAYNNTNGKMTLDTMKTFVQPDLSGYQETLTPSTGIDITSNTITNTGVTSVNSNTGAVNIKTINGSSIIGTGNVDISGGVAYSAGTGIDITSGTISNTGVTSVNGQTGAVTVSGMSGGGYDAIVDAAGNGDYTTIGAAVAAGKINIFVKNGNYTESEGWNNNSGKLQITGESKEGVNVTIPSDCNPATSTYFIYVGNSPEYILINNITFTISLTTISQFYHTSNTFTLRIVNCKFTYTKNNNYSKNYLFYCTGVLGNTNHNVRSNFKSGIYNCEFYTESDTVRVWYGSSYFKDCKFDTGASAGEMSFEYGDNLFEDCRFTVFKLDGNDFLFERCVVTVLEGGLVSQSNSPSTPYLFDVNYCRETDITIGQNLSQTTTLRTGLTDKCDIGVMDTNMIVNIGGGIWESGSTYTAHCKVSVPGAVTFHKNAFDVNVNCTSLTLGGTGNQRFIGILSSATTVSFSNQSDCLFTGIILTGGSSGTHGTISVAGTDNIIMGNSFIYYDITDTGTNNLKVNNLGQS